MSPRQAIVSVRASRSLLLALALLISPVLRASGTLSDAPSFFGIAGGNALVNLNDLLGATSFYNAGIDGQNTISWVVDAQLVGTNLFPAGQYTNVAYTYAASDALTSPGYHATWCAGLLGGYIPPGYYVNTGMAPLTTLGSAALATATNADGSFDISSSSLTAYNYAATHGDVLSTSIGDSSDPSGIGILSGLVDSLAFSNPNTTIVIAAGNNGPTSGTVGGPASGYNGISVGALDGPTNYSTIAPFSSRGPQPTAWYDGTSTYLYNGGTASRPAVDIVAPGADILMPVTIDSNSVTYYSLAGTSFATPLVAGGVALLDSTAKIYFNLSLTNAATQSVVTKAVLMNSADKLSGWDNGQQILNGVITTTQALDWAMGAGRMNLNAAFSQYTTQAYVTTSPGLSYSGFNLAVASTGWGYGTALLGGINSYTLATQLFAGQQLAVTLDWMRSRSWNASLSDYIDVAQAELDLMIYRILDTGGDQLVGESISPVSTTQELYFQLAETGNYQIRVGYSTNLFDLSGGYGTQNYGLAWNVTGVPEPESLVLFLAGGMLIFLRLLFLQKPGTAN